MPIPVAVIALLFVITQVPRNVVTTIHVMRYVRMDAVMSSVHHFGLALMVLICVLHTCTVTDICCQVVTQQPIDDLFISRSNL